MKKLIEANIGNIYCATEKCSVKNRCIKHKNRYKFDKSKKYSFVDFGEDYCIKNSVILINKYQVKS